MPDVEEIKNQSSDEPDSDSKFEDEPTEEENQDDTSSAEAQEERQPGGPAGRLRPKPAYLSSHSKSQKQSLFAVISDSWSQSQRKRYSHTERSDFWSIVMVSGTGRLWVPTTFVPQLIFYYLCLTPWALG